ncbi:Integral membrane protein [Pleurostoma richardsiae]|uniref:Integral membrane protein n=1 Tax=Pleurostoma richardsiae TaxID=41990 RepID=A0AA38VWG1_9PEZI|nr:Integral membrane protein [Pleurostoma richardsiae]
MGASVFDLVGKVDNLHDPVPVLNKREAVLGVVITFLLLSWSCAAVRLYTRVFTLRCPGWDDFFVVLVMVTTLVLSIGTCLALDHGLGKHFLTLSLDEVQDFIKAFYIPNGAYPMSTALIKLALLFQYLRIFEDGTRLRYITMVAIAITALWGVAFSFIAWVPCYPVEAYWNWSIEAKARWGFGSHDANVFAGTYISQVSTNVLLDLTVFAIPIPLYFRPGLSSKSRIGLFGLIFLGAVVNMLSIWRLVSIVQSKAGTYPTLDPSWYGSVPIVLAALEVDLALICASLPVFWPVVQSSLGRIFVTREVNVTREDRRYSTQDEDAELCDMSPSPRLPPVAGKKRYSDPFVRWAVDPLRFSKAATTTVESVGQADAAERPYRQEFSRMKKESKDSLLNET